jgi:predicted metal-binding protein
MKIGIIICNRYNNCAGGKCFKAMRNREGAFDIYKIDDKLETVGYIQCGGCPGGNIEYAPEEMIKNGAEAIHFATGFIVGYPPCQFIIKFRNFIEEKYGIKAVMGTHPIPQKYYVTHKKLGTWNSAEWKELIKPTLSTETIRKSYD